MSRNLRWAVFGGALLLLVILFLVLRPGEPGTPPAPPRASATASQAIPTPAPTTSPPEGEDIRIRVTNARVQGPDRISVVEGSDVRIVIIADVSDEVHVHGYDLTQDVEPGRSARIEFEATIPGVFEVELENAGRQLFRLEVTS